MKIVHAALDSRAEPMGGNVRKRNFTINERFLVFRVSSNRKATL